MPSSFESLTLFHAARELTPQGVGRGEPPSHKHLAWKARLRIRIERPASFSPAARRPIRSRPTLPRSEVSSYRTRTLPVGPPSRSSPSQAATSLPSRNPRPGPTNVRQTPAEGVMSFVFPCAWRRGAPPFPTNTTLDWGHGQASPLLRAQRRGVLARHSRRGPVKVFRHATARCGSQGQLGDGAD